MNKEMRLLLQQRKSHRGAIRGRELEVRVAFLLAHMKEQGLITDFTRHRPYSLDDMLGKDFTVWQSVGGELHEVSFGVTVSHRKPSEWQLDHPDVREFYFPIETKDETIVKRILALFPCAQ